MVPAKIEHLENLLKCSHCHCQITSICNEQQRIANAMRFVYCSDANLCKEHQRTYTGELKRYKNTRGFQINNILR